MRATGKSRHKQTPLYQQISEEIVARINKGVWLPGDALPSEMALAEELMVSQGTVRKALDELTHRNLVTRHQGKGTFVTAHTAQRELFHFFNLTRDDGRKQLPTTKRIIGIENRRGNSDECTRLKLKPATRVIFIERIRELGKRSAIFETIVLPAKMFRGLGMNDTLPNELYQLYEQQYGVTIHKAVERIGAISADRNHARHLNVQNGAPLLEIDRLAETLDGTPAEWRRSQLNTISHKYIGEII